MKRNVPVLGFFVGLLMPVLGFLVVYLILGRSQSLSGFVGSLMDSHNRAAMVLSLSILANILPFMYCTSKRLDYTARGILIATMLYAVVIVLLKFVW